VAGFTLKWVVGHILWNSETCNWYTVVTKVDLCLQAKSAASMQDKWLMVNIQSTKEFSSHMVFYSQCSIFDFLDYLIQFYLYWWQIFFFVKLNRDTWANEAVSQTIKTNFIFWQVSLLLCSPEHWWSIFIFIFIFVVLFWMVRGNLGATGKVVVMWLKGHGFKSWKQPLV